jgi:hypothetical protein
MENTFDNEGFLSDEINDIKEIILNRFPNTFAKCREVNHLAYRFRNTITLDYDNQLHLILICLLQKILDSFQSMILLMSLGLEGDSDTITRASIEVMLQIRKLVLDSKYLERYVGSDQLRRKKLLNIAKNKPKSILASILHGPALEETLAEIIADINKMNLSEISIEQIAHDVGLDAWYDLTYRTLSEGAHAGPRSLEKYLHRNEKGDVLMFDFNPKCDRLVTVIITHAAIVLIAVDSLEKVFQCGYETQIDALFTSIRDFKEE